MRPWCTKPKARGTKSFIGRACRAGKTRRSRRTQPRSISWPFFNTKDVGPIVLEIPPADEDGSFTGNIVDVWQAALEDVGPAGVDKGKGGKMLILPPGYKEQVPNGYIALPSETYRGYALLRSIL